MSDDAPVFLSELFAALSGMGLTWTLQCILPCGDQDVTMFVADSPQDFRRALADTLGRAMEHPHAIEHRMHGHPVAFNLYASEAPSWDYRSIAREVYAEYGVPHDGLPASLKPPTNQGGYLN